MPNHKQSLENLSRREFLEYGARLGGGVLAAALMPSAAIAQEGKIRYTDTFTAGRVIREKFIEQLVKGKKPDYVSIEYNTPKLLEELNTKFSYDTSNSFTIIFPMDSSYKGKGLQPAPLVEFGNGAKTKIIALDEIFEDPLKKSPFLKEYSNTLSDLYKDHELIVENELTTYPFKLAHYLNKGLPGYPTKSFRGSGGEINYDLYKTLIRFLPFHDLFMAFIQSPRFKSSIYLQLAGYYTELSYRKHYETLSDRKITKDIDPKLIEKIKREFAPQKLLPSPSTIINL